MKSETILVLFIILWIIFVVWSLYKGYRKKRFAYELKRTMHPMIILVGVIWCDYFVIGACVLMPAVIKWASEVALIQTYNLAKNLIIIAPLVYSFTIIATACLVFKMVVSSVKYSDKEKEWQKEESGKFLSWLRKIKKKPHNQEQKI